MVGRHYGTRSGEFVEFDVADFPVSGVQDKGLMWLNWAMVHLLPAVKSFLTGSLHVPIVGPTIVPCKRPVTSLEYAINFERWMIKG